MKRVILAFAPFLAVVLALSACDLQGSTRDERSPRTKPGRVAVSQDGRITIVSLDMSFKLPESFDPVDDPSLTFVARSADPLAVFSIDRDTPGVVDHEPEGEERMSATTIDGVDAVVIDDARLDGLPPGIVAKELLVANGDRSFSVILSSTENELSQLWDAFIASVKIESA